MIATPQTVQYLSIFADRCRREAHSVAWYDSPSNQPSNLPLPLKNPFSKRKPRYNTRNNNEQHLQEAGGIGGRNLRAVKSDNQDYRPTSSLDRARELGVEDTKPHH